jgi:hypothetical protein
MTVKLTRVLAVPVLGLIVCLLPVGCASVARTAAGGDSTGPNASAPPASESPSSAHPLEVRIVLDETTVRAGQAISGEAIVNNATSHELVITACRTWLQVGLTSATVPFEPGWLDCLSPATVSVGVTRIPILVRTTYDECTPHADAATARTPACLHSSDGSMMPPLPPGSYATKAGILEPEGVRVPAPPPIQVTLTP